MNIKEEVENIKQLPLEKRAKLKTRSERIAIFSCLAIFIFLALVYRSSSPKQHVVGWDNSTYTFEKKYPDGSIYNTLAPNDGAYLIFLAGIVASWVVAVTYGKRWKEYNEVVTAAKKEYEKIQEQKRQELQKQKEDKFCSTITGLVERYGEPDAKLVIDDSFDINSYIIPFSKVKRVMVMGKDMSFSDIIDVQLYDDKNIIKGKITAEASLDSGSVVGRALVGGLVAGGAGAIIGGSTAKQNIEVHQENDKVIHDYNVLVTTSNISSPSIKIKLKERRDLANQIVATIKSVMANK